MVPKSIRNVPCLALTGYYINSFGRSLNSVGEIFYIIGGMNHVLTLGKKNLNVTEKILLGHIGINCMIFGESFPNKTAFPYILPVLFSFIACNRELFNGFAV